MELTQLLSWPRAEHPSMSRVCWLSRNCLYIVHCMTDGIQQVDITALEMSSAVSPTKENVWVKGWARSDHGAFTETKTNLIWIKGFLRSFRPQTTDRGCRTLFYFLSVIPEAWRHKALHRVRFGSLNPQLKSRSRIVSKAWAWNHGLRVPSWLWSWASGHAQDHVRKERPVHHQKILQKIPELKI